MKCTLDTVCQECARMFTAYEDAAYRTTAHITTNAYADALLRIMPSDVSEDVLDCVYLLLHRPGKGVQPPVRN